MIMQPDCATDAVVTSAIEQVRKKKAPIALDRLRLEVLDEGRCAQILHLRHFSEEGPTIERLHAYIDAHSGRTGKHHEIYLSDIRGTAPEKWKTIIRQPMRGRC
jgi:hypothetical protein